MTSVVECEEGGARGANGRAASASSHQTNGHRKSIQPLANGHHHHRHHQHHHEHLNGHGGQPTPNKGRRMRLLSRDLAPRVLTAGLRQLGRYVGLYPYFFIVGTLAFALIFGAAILKNLTYTTDLSLYIPTNAESWHDRDVAEQFFRVNFSGKFQPDRVAQFGSFGHVLLYPKDGGSVLRRECFDEILRVDAMVKNVTVPLPSPSGTSRRFATYRDLCARWGDECFFSDAVKLARVVSDVESGAVNLTFPAFFDERAFEYVILPGSIGKPVLEGDVVRSAPAVGLYFILKAGTDEEIALGRAWEEEFIRQMKDIKGKLDVVDVFYESRYTVEVEFDSLKVYVPLLSLFAGIIVCVFSVLCCMMADWVKAKPVLAIFGLSSTVLATICAYGFLMSLGLPFTTVVFVTPFLMLGIGMDDTFLMLAAWRKTNVNTSVEERVSETYAEAAVSMTITSLTNFLSFLIGAVSPFGVLNIFCIYSGISILFLYLFQITYFGAWMAIYGRLEKDNRHSVTGRKVMTLAEAEKQGRSKLYRLLCTGGHEPADANDDGEGATNHAVMVFFREKFAVALTKSSVKFGVLLLFLAYLAGGIYGLFQLEEGLSLKRLVPDHSYYVDFYDRRFRDFMDYPYRVPIVLAGRLDYSNKTLQDDIERLLQRIEGHKFYAQSEYTDSWLRKLLKFAKLANKHADVIDLSNETVFNENVKGLLASGENSKNQLDVVFDDDGHIVASRFIVQIANLTGLPDLKDCMLFLRHVLREEFSGYNLTGFNPMFSFAELLIGARMVAIQTVGMAAAVMLVIALIMIPESKCALYVGFSLVSIELGVVGYMALWGVSLDCVSVACLVMCIGFSVDFSAHVTHSFISSPVTSSSLGRLQDAVEKAGLPILQGAASSVLGVVSMALMPAYTFVIFVKTITLVMVFGAVHGIVFLPILLEMTDSSGAPGGGGDENKDGAGKRPKIESRAVLLNSSSMSEASDKLGGPMLTTRLSTASDFDSGFEGDLPRIPTGSTTVGGGGGGGGLLRFIDEEDEEDFHVGNDTAPPPPVTTHETETRRHPSGAASSVSCYGSSSGIGSDEGPGKSSSSSSSGSSGSAEEGSDADDEVVVKTNLVPKPPRIHRARAIPGRIDRL